MNNDMNAFELSDAQLEEITGAGTSIGSPQIGINLNVQTNIGIAPTTGVAIGAGLKLDGAKLNLGNLGLLGNTNKQQ